MLEWYLIISVIFFIIFIILTIIDVLTESFSATQTLLHDTIIIAFFVHIIGPLLWPITLSMIIYHYIDRKIKHDY